MFYKHADIHLLLRNSYEIQKNIFSSLHEEHIFISLLTVIFGTPDEIRTRNFKIESLAAYTISPQERKY